MTREDIIRMAQQAGFEELFKGGNDWVCFTEEIERFAALVNGSHEITSVTIRPKNTVLIDIIHAWQAIEETSGHLSDEGDIEGRMRISVIRKAWKDMDDLVRDAWDEGGRP